MIRIDLANFFFRLWTPINETIGIGRVWLPSETKITFSCAYRLPRKINFATSSLEWRTVKRLISDCHRQRSKNRWRLSILVLNKLPHSLITCVCSIHLIRSARMRTTAAYIPIRASITLMTHIFRHTGLCKFTCHFCSTSKIL